MFCMDKCDIYIIEYKYSLIVFVVCGVELGSVGAVFCGVGGIDVTVTVNEKNVLSAKLATERKD